MGLLYIFRSLMAFSSRISLKASVGLLTGQEDVVVRGVGVVVTRRDHATFHSQVSHRLKESVHVFHVHATVDSGVGAYPVTRVQGRFYGLEGPLEDALAGDSLVVLFLHAVHVDDPREVLEGGTFFITLSRSNPLVQQ